MRELYLCPIRPSMFDQAPLCVDGRAAFSISSFYGDNQKAVTEEAFARMHPCAWWGLCRKLRPAAGESKGPVAK